MSTPTKRVFNARDLAGSGYESCDSLTPTTPTPRTTTIPHRPRGERPRAVMHPDWPVPDQAIVAVLTQKVTIRNDTSGTTSSSNSRNCTTATTTTTTLLEAALPGCGASPSNQPPYDLAVKLHNAMRDSGLSLAQKQQLFVCLEWVFECVGCQQVKKPEAFCRKGFHLWGPKVKEAKTCRPRLRSGPCVECVKDMRECDDPDVLVVLDVDLPPECKGGKVKKV